MAATPSSAPGTAEIPGAPGLKRSLSVWAAVGLSVAPMAPSIKAGSPSLAVAGDETP
jgi:hypothetical protein